MGGPAMSWRSMVATVLLWSGVPLWVLVALGGPDPFAFGLLLAALVSLPALVVTALVVGRGLAHLVAVASFPVSAAVGAVLEQRRADAFLAGLEADAADCARSVLRDQPRQGEVSPAELYQDPQRLALARNVALAERAVACLRAVRGDVEDCLSSSAICSVAPRDRFPGRGGVSVSLVPALRAEHWRQEQLARSGRGLPPAPLGFGGAREEGPAARPG